MVSKALDVMSGELRLSSLAHVISFHSVIAWTNQINRVGLLAGLVRRWRTCADSEDDDSEGLSTLVPAGLVLDAADALGAQSCSTVALAHVRKPFLHVEPVMRATVDNEASSVIVTCRMFRKHNISGLFSSFSLSDAPVLLNKWKVAKRRSGVTRTGLFYCCSHYGMRIIQSEFMHVH
jgi:hypothetical protein